MMERTKCVRLKWILRMGFCLALIAAMVLIGAVLAGAEDVTYSEGLKFTSNGDGTCSVSGIGTCTDTKIVIPPVSPEGDIVIEISKRAFRNNKSIISVIIPEGVEIIGEYAFASSTNLAYVSIPDSVISVGQVAFNGTQLLQKENGVTYVGKWVVTCDSDISTVVLRDDTIGIAESAFQSKSNMKNITLPAGLISIGRYAFSSCYNLEGINIPTGVMLIGDNAFYGCEKITEIVLPESVTHIGNGAFWNCKSLTKMSISKNVIFIGTDCNPFANCENIQNISVDPANSAYCVSSNCLIEIASKKLICGWRNCTIPDDGSVKTICKYAFSKNKNITHMDIPEGITSIGASAFDDCTSLKSVILPESLVSIGGFKNCVSLETIVLNSIEANAGNADFSDAGKNTPGLTVIVGSKVKKIPDRLFGSDRDAGAFTNYKPKISRVVFEEGSVCTEIGYGSFASSINMSINLPEGLTKIGDYAFFHCYLKDIYIPDSVNTIGIAAFEQQALTSINIPKNLKNLGASAFANCYLLEYIYYNAVDLGYLGTGQYSLNAFWAAGNNGDGITVIVGKEVERIPGSLFEIYSNYFNYRLPPKIVRVEFDKDSVCTAIGAWSFSDIISLQELYLGANVSEIADSAFAFCPNLQTIVVDKNNDNLYCVNNCLMSYDGTVILGGANSAIPDDGTVKKIGAYAYHTRSVKNQYLPNGLEQINHCAFYGSFSTIVIPETVTYIDKLAFCAGGGIGMGYNQKITKLETAYFENTYGWYRIIHANNNRYPVDVTDPYESAKLLLSGRATSWLDESIRCTPTQFTITFIADGKIVATVPYWTTDHNIEIPAVPHKPGYSGVWEDFDLTNGGDITVHAIYTPTESQLTGASVSLGQSLALNYYATLTPAHTAAQMRFTYHGETITVDGILDETTGEYKFTLGRIPPQCMGDNVKAELILISEDGTETILDVKESYSIRRYCDDALAANPNNEALATLLADLLAYGDASQKYTGYQEEAPVSDGFPTSPSEWQEVTSTDFTLTDSTRDDIRFTAAGVRFAYVNRVYFKIKAADLTGVTLTVNGKTYTADDLTLAEDTADTYIFYTEAVYATEFDKVFTAELSADGEVIQTVTYSVKSYVCAKQNSNDTEIAALVKALYNYGRSAIAYKNAQ